MVTAKACPQRRHIHTPVARSQDLVRTARHRPNCPVSSILTDSAPKNAGCARPFPEFTKESFVATETASCTDLPRNHGQVLSKRHRGIPIRHAQGERRGAGGLTGPAVRVRITGEHLTEPGLGSCRSLPKHADRTGPRPRTIFLCQANVDRIVTCRSQGNSAPEPERFMRIDVRESKNLDESRQLARHVDNNVFAANARN